jgi:hypothetical protein
MMARNIWRTRKEELKRKSNPPIAVLDRVMEETSIKKRRGPTAEISVVNQQRKC